MPQLGTELTLALLAMQWWQPLALANLVLGVGLLVYFVARNRRR